MNTRNMKLVLSVTWFVGLLGSPLHAADLGPRDATMWFYEEWSLENPSCDRNPFDVVARVAFAHAGSDQTRTTEMFYAGDATWKFRFTGTRLGEWRFTTVSDAPELNGHNGTIMVRPNPSPKIRGFLTHKGNRFAMQMGNNADLVAYRFNVYMNRTRLSGTIIGLPDKADDFRALLADAEQHGFDTIFVHVVNNWFRYGALKYSEHDSDRPDLRTFAALETAITAAHRQGCRVHIWAWGDESRKWTPIGVGGINGPADRRFQRYIAARLGPLPGWTMGYGFDLHEWTKQSQLDDWSNYLHAHLGWDHLLCARGHRLPDRANNMNSYDGFGRGVELTNGHCLKTPDNTKYVFYKEDADTIRLDLSDAAVALKAVAVDTTKEYREIDLGSLRPVQQTIKLPATSDWAVAVGKF